MNCKINKPSYIYVNKIIILNYFLLYILLLHDIKIEFGSCWVPGLQRKAKILGLNFLHVLNGSPYETNIFFKTHLTCKLLESSNKCIINCNKMSFNHENPKSCLHRALMQTAGPAHK